MSARPRLFFGVPYADVDFSQGLPRMVRHIKGEPVRFYWELEMWRREGGWPPAPLAPIGPMSRLLNNISHM